MADRICLRCGGLRPDAPLPPEELPVCREMAVGEAVPESWIPYSSPITHEDVGLDVDVARSSTSGPAWAPGLDDLHGRLDLQIPRRETGERGTAVQELGQWSGDGLDEGVLDAEDRRWSRRHTAQVEATRPRGEGARGRSPLDVGVVLEPPPDLFTRAPQIPSSSMLPTRYAAISGRRGASHIESCSECSAALGPVRMFEGELLGLFLYCRGW